jgi:hypothetical protein
VTTLKYVAELTVVTCWCGIRHAVPSELADFQDRQHRDGQDQRSIYCPLGHTHIHSGEGEAARLRKQLDAEKARSEYWRKEQERTEAKRRATQGQLTKARNRARGGLCPTPQCKRSFVDVARHVRSKHPQLLESATSER